MTYHVDFILSTVVHWHVSPFSGIFMIGSQLAHEILQSKATLHKNSSFPILTSDHVFRVQCGCRANSDSLFSGRNLTHH